MKKNFIAYVLNSSISILATTSTFAGAMGKEPPQDWTWTWAGSLSVGGVLESEGRTQSLFLTPEISKTYIAGKSTSGLFEGEVFGGIHITGTSISHGEVGLVASATTNATLAGFIWDDMEQQFDNYTYSYTLQHTYVGIKGKYLAEGNYWVTPWLSASLGVGFNRASTYDNQPIIFEAIPNENFGPHSGMTFSYTVGAGLQKALNEQYQVGIGYEFADWGKSNLSSAIGQTIGSGLKLQHFYTNGILVNVTYLV